MDEKMLLKNIESLRKEMTTAAITKGLTSMEVIALSQELDQLLNLYDQMKQHQKEKVKQ
ncbi:aspartyl-phosphate phosphatase Spo0E family protein [Lentibacillus sp. N15]|uniref:aspartyl-phosphate phosphatase Spo0E family protein n=1 Tax=Lentibacillus songyuanensis TaxID=3136161 RepID=UPI0031BA43AC